MEYTTYNWIDSITDENGVYIGQDKEVVSSLFLPKNVILLAPFRLGSRRVILITMY